MPEKGLKAVCGQEQPNGRVCARGAFDSSGRCYLHSPQQAERRRKYASRGGHTGGPGRRNLRAARREIGELKEALKRLAFLIAHGVGDSLIESRERDVRDVLALTREYLRLTELQLKLGMDEAEARKDVAERLAADELLGALGDSRDETDPDPPLGNAKNACARCRG